MGLKQGTRIPAILLGAALLALSGCNLGAGIAPATGPPTVKGIVTTLAGSGSKLLGSIGNVARDAAGNLYAADNTHQTVVKISPAGSLTTLAGSVRGYADGAGTAAKFDLGLAFGAAVGLDGSGNLYVADRNNGRIRKVDPNGVVTTIAGNGNNNPADGTGTAAQFARLQDLAVDVAGNVFVSDGNAIRKIDTTAVVTTLAGSATIGFADGSGAAAQFDLAPTGGIGLDKDGNVLVADGGNKRLRKVTAAGMVTTLAAGTGATLPSFPRDVAADSSGNVYVTESATVLKRDPSGALTTLAGGGTGLADGTGTTAQFGGLDGITIGADGNLYLAEGARVRKVDPAGIVTTLVRSTEGFVDGPATAAQFNWPWGLAVDSAGNIYVSDFANYAIRKLDPAGMVNTLAGGMRGTADGLGTAAAFMNPQGITMDGSGNLYITDLFSIRKLAPGGAVTTLAGGRGGPSNGTGTAAGFVKPRGIAVDNQGNLYVADHTEIRKISPDDVVTTFIGPSGAGPFPLLDATGLARDSDGNLYVTDGNLIRKIDRDARMVTLAGSTTAGLADGTGTAAMFNHPQGLALDRNGNLYVADTSNNRVRVVSPAGVVTTLAGSGPMPSPSPFGLPPYANLPFNINPGGLADGPGTAAMFSTPTGIAVDATGCVYVADALNHRIRKIQ